MKLADYHVHTEFSDDSIYPMEQVVLDAREKGIGELCFTDHVDYGVKKDIDEDPQDRNAVRNVDYERYFAEIRRLRQDHPEMSIKAGLEFGIQMITRDRFARLFDRYRDQLDFVLLSVHQVNNREFWDGSFFQGRSQREYNLAYYRELLDLVRTWHDYSVLAHLDLIVRYDPQGPYWTAEIEDLVRQILQTVIADGKGIEINTSSVRYGLKDLQPSRRILAIYRELGGRILTFGSDSHTRAHLGAWLPEQMEEARNLGFTEYCTFEKMQPVFHAL